MTRLLAALFCIASIGCAQSRTVLGNPAGSGPLFGVYKAEVDAGDGAVRHAKISLWAEAPDRLHAELLGPMGGVAFILDAGGGKTCVIDLGAATAYVGEDGVDAIERLVGVRVTVTDAVAALLSGTAPSGLSVTRSGVAEGSLPEALRIAEGSRSLALTQVRLVRGAGDPAALGTGVPPAKFAVEPLAHLPPAVRSER